MHRQALIIAERGKTHEYSVLNCHLKSRVCLLQICRRAKFFQMSYFVASFSVFRVPRRKILYFNLDSSVPNKCPLSWKLLWEMIFGKGRILFFLFEVTKVIVFVHVQVRRLVSNVFYSIISAETCFLLLLFLHLCRTSSWCDFVVSGASVLSLPAQCIGDSWFSVDKNFSFCDKLFRWPRLKLPSEI